MHYAAGGILTSRRISKSATTRGFASSSYSHGVLIATFVLFIARGVLSTPNTMDVFDSIPLKYEQEPRKTLKALPPQQCQASRQKCTRPRAWKRDRSLHELCTLHRRQAQHDDQRRKRLLRVLVDALKPESGDPTVAESSGNTPRRPRLVLLGNQQTLILGVVLTEQGNLSGISRQML